MRILIIIQHIILSALNLKTKLFFTFRYIVRRGLILITIHAHRFLSISIPILAISCYYTGNNPNLCFVIREHSSITSAGQGGGGLDQNTENTDLFFWDGNTDVILQQVCTKNRYFSHSTCLRGGRNLDKTSSVHLPPPSINFDQ